MSLQMNVDDRLGQIQADEREVRQVVLNLLSNAIKFTPEGGRIEVSVMPRDGRDGAGAQRTRLPGRVHGPSLCGSRPLGVDLGDGVQLCVGEPSRDQFRVLSKKIINVIRNRLVTPRGWMRIVVCSF